MRRLLRLAVVLLALACASVARADDSEDLRFAGGLFSRKWYDWAGEVAAGLARDTSAGASVRSQAAVLHVQVLRTLAVAARDESLTGEADRLEERYVRDGLIPKGGALTLDLLKLKLEQGEGLARAAQIEPNEKKRAALKEKAAAVFEDVEGAFEKFIPAARLAVAKFPPNWPAFMRNANTRRKEALLSAIWKRDYAEYLYASSFVPRSKVVPQEKKTETVTRGLKKFLRFIDGEKESPDDFDPPAPGQNGPQEPSPRFVFRLLEYKAGIGLGQCCIELGRHEEAIRQFDFLVQAEIPLGSEESAEDIARIVDIRLQAYYLEGYCFNLSGRPADAEKILREMFSRSGQGIQPDRPEVLEYWKKQGRPETALMPDIRENVYGKLAVFQLAGALSAQGRHAEAIDEVYRIFRMERERSASGRESPFEVEAAKTMADLSVRVGTFDYSIGAAFAVARGFFYREEWDDAIYYYKKVYGAPGSPAEMREYAPEALFDLGRLLYEGGRYLEAGIAFTEICRSFPDFPRIETVTALLKQSFRKACETAAAAGEGGGFEKQEYDKVRELASRILGTVGIPKLPDVTALIAERDYEGLIDAYEAIGKTCEVEKENGRKETRPVLFYAYARAQVGYYCYMRYLRLKEKDPNKALEKLKKAVAALEEALEEAPALEDAKAEAMARYYLAKCLLEDVWKKHESKANSRKALELLKAFKVKFEDSKYAAKFLPDVLATNARARFNLEDYDGMHSAFREMEKYYRTGKAFRNACLILYELVKEHADNLARKNPQPAEPFYQKAAYYVFALYMAAGSDLSSKDLLWVGNALFETGSFGNAAVVLEKSIAVLPAPAARSREQKEQAAAAKILLAEARYAAGEYRAAAGLFNILRRTVACPKCGHEEVLKPEDFDKLMKSCPACGKDEVRLEKANDLSLQIQEGAAKSCLAVYEKLDRSDMQALNRAMDIYQRIHMRMQKSGAEEKSPAKLWEIRYCVLKTWFYLRDFDGVIKAVKMWLLFSRPGAHPDNPSEEDWKAAIPVQPWRDRIRELYRECLKSLKQH